MDKWLLIVENPLFMGITSFFYEHPLRGADPYMGVLSYSPPIYRIDPAVAYPGQKT